MNTRRKNTKRLLRNDITSQYTREELAQLIREKDLVQSRQATAEEFGISMYTLRNLCSMLDLNLPKGRFAKYKNL